MASPTGSVLKTLIVPAVIALILYLVLAYGIVPIWRHYRERYSHYVPLGSISTRTSGLRDRLTNHLANFLFNFLWRQNEPHGIPMADGTSDDGLSLDGEELGILSEERRRELVRSAQSSAPDSTRRLSRDLEEGFMDDSDDDETEVPDQRARISSR